MGLLSDIKNGRKALVIANSLRNKSENDLNTLLFDLRTKYSIVDDDWMRIEASIALLTSRKVLEQIGLKNDDVLSGGDSNVEPV